MQAIRTSRAAIDAYVGYAAGAHGLGVAYARLTGRHDEDLLRVGFRLAGAERSERAIGYSALTAVARELSRRNIRRVSLHIADKPFAEEIATGRGVVEVQAIAYVRLRCVLNSLGTYDIRVGNTDDLTQRARAEVALNVAA
ncbi:MAG: hypothetical protein JOZ77_03955 [Candidatus Eremiobacteraeota bacterium]|nr:hypothetical protein [Candidatus Eremiobacteraeota bacterium]